MIGSSSQSLTSQSTYYFLSLEKNGWFLKTSGFFLAERRALELQKREEIREPLCDFVSWPISLGLEKKEQHVCCGFFLLSEYVAKNLRSDVDEPYFLGQKGNIKNWLS